MALLYSRWDFVKAFINGSILYSRWDFLKAFINGSIAIFGAPSIPPEECNNYNNTMSQQKLEMSC